ncbi:hypothetical protein OROMI_010058 [Orobanche minor]
MAAVNVKKPHLIDRPWPTLPEDIIFYQIFPRLPVKTLHRFRCISTFCRRLTSDRQFLTAVRHLSPATYFLSFSSSLPTKISLYSVSPTQGSTAIVAHNIGNPNDHNIYAKVINGFTCLVHQNHQVFVRNFATNEKLALPVFQNPSTKLDRLFFYFCHDPSSNRYKVLSTKSIGVYNDPRSSVMMYPVITLGDKSWRNSNLKGLYQLGNSKSVCINGSLYFNKFSRSPDYNRDEVIGAFDVKREFFYAVSYPKGLSRSRYNECHLIEVKGALAIIEVEDFMSCDIRLWIKEIGFGSSDDGSWKEHRIMFDSRWETLYSMTLNYSFSSNRDSEIVMASTGLKPRYGLWLFVYNMDNREWRRVEIVGVDKSITIVGQLSIEEFVETPLLLREISTYEARGLHFESKRKKNKIYKLGQICHIIRSLPRENR